MKFISTTALAKKYNEKPKDVFEKFQELGFIARNGDIWELTEKSLKWGAKYKESKQHGRYIVWPENAFDKNGGENNIEEPEEKKLRKKETDFRSKFKAKHRATDGHFVRSKAEMVIDNWLYMAEIVHAYEKKLPIEEDVYSDFYIPSGKVYIEYWGYEHSQKYRERKTKKVELYKKYEFNLIELNDKDVLNLDDILPKLLLKYGVKAY